MNVSIPFDITVRAIGDALLERVAFWETLRPWFLSKCYTLHALHCKQYGPPKIPPVPVCSVPIFGGIDGDAPDHPYAYFGVPNTILPNSRLIRAIKTLEACSPFLPSPRNSRTGSSSRRMLIDDM
ncbi:hypothetical protein BV25DRAFT_1921024 [Artomyces pyxidatus]|uniref:Uncharacterized protein n=1 Tax=Artomyces pyxidatus TaxID=48021 RepID=A0ACB8SJ20_9AGAM|nr:hypothetical protein BV25DRAFT_1921024 [Artomyces pyxidatus]